MYDIEEREEQDLQESLEKKAEEGTPNKAPDAARSTPGAGVRLFATSS